MSPSACSHTLWVPVVLLRLWCSTPSGSASHWETFEPKQTVSELHTIQILKLTQTTSAHTCTSRGLIRAPLITESSGPDRLGSSPSCNLGSSMPPVSAQMNDCWARLTICPMHLSKWLWKVVLNKEKSVVIPDAIVMTSSPIVQMGLPSGRLGLSI